MVRELICLAEWGEDVGQQRKYDIYTTFSIVRASLEFKRIMQLDYNSLKKER